MPPKPLAINHRAALAIIQYKQCTFLRQNNIKIYNKTLQNLSFFLFFFMQHFPQHPRKGVCNEIFTIKETCSPTLNCVYCFTGFI